MEAVTSSPRSVQELEEDGSPASNRDAVTSQQAWLAKEVESAFNEDEVPPGVAAKGPAAPTTPPKPVPPPKPASAPPAAEWFDGAASKPGVEAWRIEQMVPVRVPSKMLGQFYEGDAYIIAKTTREKGKNTLDVDIFFWLGEQSSQDEQGVAAYKTVELDEHLGGRATQHREVMHHESERFLRSFARVEYLPGGVASGFKHVERDVYEPRLLHVKGQRLVRVCTVPMTSASLNAGDVFVLDLGMELLQWNGVGSNRKEKAKALDVCLGIKDDERGGKPTVDVCEQGKEPPRFWAALGGEGPIAAATPDLVKDNPKRRLARLYRVSDASGAVVTKEVGGRADAAGGAGPARLEYSLLDSGDVFLLDNEAEIFVWVGKGAAAAERTKGMALAQQYCTDAGRPKSTRVIKVSEGTEPVTFKSNFAAWPKPGAGASVRDFSATGRGNIAEVSEQESADALVSSLGDVAAEEARLHAAEHAALSQHETVEVVTYRIEDMEPVRIDESLFGRFYAGDSYIVHHKYISKSDEKEHHSLYYWLGRHSSQDEKTSAAIHTVKMDDALGGAASQVRVVMGKEPAFFVHCFGGALRVRMGGKSSGFRNRQDADNEELGDTALFQVHGTDAAHTHAVQVEAVAGSLNSMDVFVLQTPDSVIVWEGGGSSASEDSTARTVAAAMQGARSLQVVTEGSEPEAFWTALGGQGPYAKERALVEGGREPMLFHCSNSTGTLQVEPVHDFCQADLAEDDVYLLDTYSTLFVWLGSAANEAERAGADDAARAYLTAHHHDDDVPIVTIKSGSEPPLFTCHFLGWDAAPRAKFVCPYEAKLRRMQEERVAAQAAAEAAAAIAAAEAAAEAAVTQGLMTGAPPAEIEAPHTPGAEEPPAEQLPTKRPSWAAQKMNSVAKRLSGSVSSLRPTLGQSKSAPEVNTVSMYSEMRAKLKRSSLPPKAREEVAHELEQRRLEKLSPGGGPAAAAAGDSSEPVSPSGRVSLRPNQAPARGRAMTSASTLTVDGTTVMVAPSGTAPVAAHVAPVSIRPNQAARSKPRTVSMFSGPSGGGAVAAPAAISAPPIFLRGAPARSASLTEDEADELVDPTSPLERPRKKYGSYISDAPSPIVAPVSLRPNVTPVKYHKPDVTPGAAGRAAPIADPTRPVLPGSSVSATIFNQEFAEPAGATYTYNYEELKLPVEQLPKGVDPRKREQYLSDEEFERVLGTPRAAFDQLRGWRQAELKRKAGLF